MCEVTSFWGLFSYQPQWGLTPLGWLVVGLVLVLITGLMVVKIHPFLAPRQPVEAEILLVEGWVSDDVMIGAITEFYRGNYQLIITTGSPLIKGHFLCEYKNFADLAAATLVALGFEQSKIISIPSPVVAINRTQSAALTVRDWLLNYSEPIKGVNIYSWDVHTRRSWLLYRQTLQPEWKVGAIAHPPEFYDPQTWWTSSAGVRSIIPEAIAYLYARLS
ncbi:MAG: YdcF family protein [Gloeocapsa sp. DLM2.Bin57]|nr:MAG: YdcF family protein [Gloeocapsa sp. DLM2.Bin57]